VPANCGGDGGEASDIGLLDPVGEATMVQEGQLECWFTSTSVVDLSCHIMSVACDAWWCGMVCGSKEATSDRMGFHQSWCNDRAGEEGLGGNCRASKLETSPFTAAAWYYAGPPVAGNRKSFGLSCPPVNHANERTWSMLPA
jgi:hypothetical protein